MNLSYDPKVDVLYIRLTESQIDHSDESAEDSDFILDFDKGENIVGVEILGISEKMQKAAPTKEEAAA